MSEHPIIFSYTNCSKEDFHANVNFSEAEISKELTRCFETNMEIQRIHVELIQASANPIPQLVCSIKVDSPVFKFECHDEGFDFMQVIRGCINTTVEYVHKQKDKHLNQ